MKEQRLALWSWAFYDFANSAYSTSVQAVIFNYYFVSVVAASGATLLGTLVSGPGLWGYATSFSMLMAAVAAPVLGAMADFSASKKGFLLIFTYFAVLTTGLLFFVQKGDIWMAVVLYVLSNFAFEGCFSFYSAFLPEIAPRERMGSVSGFGWAAGYLGGVLCLVLNVLMTQHPAWFGIRDTGYLPVRFSMVVVALWWAVFALPMFLWVPERRREPVVSLRFATVTRKGFERILSTFRKARHYPELIKFLVAFLIYNDGIQTTIVMATPFGAEVLGMSLGQLTAFFVMVQVVALAGALLFGYLGDRIPVKTAIILSLLVWVGALVYVLWVSTIRQFWILGVVVGLVLGGSQSASRALFAQFTPIDNTAEFFGFFSVSGKFASILGPSLFAVVMQITGAVRLAVFSVLFFFVLGLVLLFFVDARKGIEQSATSVD
jgi:UMF1 family MFS transporter